MKRIVALIMVVSMSVVAFSACGNKDVTAPTCDELITAYNEAGYHTFHDDNHNGGDGYDWNCYVKVWADDENDYAFFYFYDTYEEAKARDDEREYNVLIYMFSAIYGNAQWLKTKTYGNIEYEYVNSDLIKPFKEMTN